MYSQCSVTSASLNGVEAVPVDVEVAVSSGLPGFFIVGMGDKSVQEARERVSAAIRASGFLMPAADKIVVNLAPGDLRKSGSGFDLPIALGILAATQQIDREILKNRLFVGELSLEGSVREVTGTLAYAICAAKLGHGLVCATSAKAPIDDLRQEYIESLGRMHQEEPFAIAKKMNAYSFEKEQALDFKDIAGHDIAKRALQIAAAGRHGVLMVGPPGSGKTMLASRIPSILPPLEENERMESALVHSVVGERIDAILAGIRPFRHPHHSATMPGLLGGGRPVRPGEVSLAHCGVLFLDELTEFKNHVLQGLRQPIEEGSVNITRATGNVRMPADFMLVAATNPCPCGYYGDDTHECSCTERSIRKYQARVGGPLIDRLDIQLDIQRLPTSDVLNAGSGTDSETLREGVIKARQFASWRLAQEKDPDASQIPKRLTSKTSSRDVIDACGLEGEEQDFVVSIADSNDLSARSLINSLRVARTIADMEESISVGIDHLAEAFGFRLSGLFGA